MGPFEVRPAAAIGASADTLSRALVSWRRASSRMGGWQHRVAALFVTMAVLGGFFFAPVPHLQRGLGSWAL